MNWFVYFSLFIILLSYLCSLRVFAIRNLLIAPAGTPGQLLRAFSYFLLFIFIGESFGVAWPRIIYHFTPFSRSNQWFYTIFHFFTYLFYLWFYLNILKLPRIRKTVRVFLVIYVLGAVLNFLFVQGPVQLNTFTDLMACFMMVFMSIAFYYQLIHASEFLRLQEQPVFWISTGLLIYHLGSMMGLFLINVMNAISEEKALDILLIIQISAILMYVSYAITCAMLIILGGAVLIIGHNPDFWWYMGIIIPSFIIA